MAIMSEFIGKLRGGADIGVTPASASISGTTASEVMHTVNVPPGETWIVAVVGTGVAGSTAGAYMPHIVIGGERVRQDTGHFAAAAIMTESGDVVFKSNASGASSFEGHIYTVKL